MPVSTLDRKHFEHDYDCVWGLHLELLHFKIKGFKVALGPVAKLEVEEREVAIVPHSAQLSLLSISFASFWEGELLGGVGFGGISL